MAEAIDKGEAIGWDEEEYSDEGHALLPAGTYRFQVADFKRKRFEGSAKMAPCPKAELSLTLMTDTGVTTVMTNLMLNTKTAFRVAQFFEALGFQKNPETGKVPAKWNEIIGKSGWLELGVREYESNGSKRQANDVTKYLKPSEWPEDAAQPQQMQMQIPEQPQMQPTYQRPSQGYVM